MSLRQPIERHRRFEALEEEEEEEEERGEPPDPPPRPPPGVTLSINARAHSRARGEQLGHICLRRQTPMSHPTQLPQINTSQKF